MLKRLKDIPWEELTRTRALKQPRRISRGVLQPDIWYIHYPQSHLGPEQIVVKFPRWAQRGHPDEGNAAKIIKREKGWTSPRKVHVSEMVWVGDVLLVRHFE